MFLSTSLQPWKRDKPGDELLPLCKVVRKRRVQQTDLRNKPRIPGSEVGQSAPGLLGTYFEITFESPISGGNQPTVSDILRAGCCCRDVWAPPGFWLSLRSPWCSRQPPSALGLQDRGGMPAWEIRRCHAGASIPHGAPRPCVGYGQGKRRGGQNRDAQRRINFSGWRIIFPHHSLVWDGG